MADTEEVVKALGRLVVFGVDQTGAYRELYEPVAAVLGPDLQTKMGSTLTSWASAGEPGTFVLTGNAGTGKTAAVQAYCRAFGCELPTSDDLVELTGGSLVAKDVSGMPSRDERASAFRAALAGRAERQSVLCANEGVLRVAVADLQGEHPSLRALMDEALSSGAATDDGLTIVNMNRQRLTSPALWGELVDYLSRAELWEGCTDCPAAAGGDSPVTGCPMRANAEALRRGGVRAALRLVIQTVSGETVPTIRELLALLAWSIVGDANQQTEMPVSLTCQQVKDQARDRGAVAFTASTAFYNLVFGEGIPSGARERSPLLSAIDRVGIGIVADLEVDDWLRDTGSADIDIQRLAGRSKAGVEDFGLVGGSLGPLDRVRTSVGEMTYHRLGELVSISEDPEMVKAATKALVASDHPVQRMWRRRVMFEGCGAMGGPARAFSRLSEFVFAPELIELAQRIASGGDSFSNVRSIVRGLNFLVAGYCDAADGLVVPEPASLFARNPGSFLSARPAFVHSTVDLSRVALHVPDSPTVGELLDVDNIEVRLIVDADSRLSFVIGPRLFQAIREADAFQGPVSEGAAEMTDLRGFYGRLAAGVDRLSGLQVADPSKSAIVRVQLPHFPGNV